MAAGNTVAAEKVTIIESPAINLFILRTPSLVAHVQDADPLADLQAIVVYTRSFAQRPFGDRERLRASRKNQLRSNFNPIEVDDHRNRPAFAALAYMADQAVSIEALARPLIEQCHRDIAAAWAQIEAAREVLKRGRWLVERWAEHSRLDEANESARLHSFGRSEAARIGMFVTVEPEAHRHRGGRNRGAGGGRTLRKGRSCGGPTVTNVPTQL